jgi:hypothetical protein
MPIVVININILFRIFSSSYTIQYTYINIDHKYRNIIYRAKRAIAPPPQLAVFFIFL